MGDKMARCPVLPARYVGGVDGTQSLFQLPHRRSGGRVLTPGVFDELPHIIFHMRMTMLLGWTSWSVAQLDLDGNRRLMVLVKQMFPGV
jgi:hypothetical protein